MPGCAFATGRRLPHRTDFHDSPLFAAADDQHLGAGSQIPHLVRDRGARARHDGRARRRARGSRREDGVGLVGDQAQDRRRPDRRDRGGGEARRDRLPDLGRRAGRPRGALPAPGHDQLRRARHLPRGPARAGRRSADRRPRRAAGGAQAPRARAQADPDDRPQPRHPRRAGHLRAQARPGLCRVRAQPRPPGRGARRHRHLRDFGRGRHLRQYRSAASKPMSPRRWASRSSRSRPRSSRATATRCSSRPWA